MLLVTEKRLIGGGQVGSSCCMERDGKG